MEQQRIANTTYTLIAGDSITIRELNSGKTTESVLNNSGTITANNTLIIDGVDKVNNITIGIKEEIPDVPVVVINDEYRKILKGNNNNNNNSNILNNTLLATPLYKTIYKEVESNNNNYQASLSAGNTLIINSGENGVLNNISGIIALDNTNNPLSNHSTLEGESNEQSSFGGGSNNTNNTSTSSIYNNLLYINTGTINNLTLSQQETTKHNAKHFEFENTTTNIGATATISSNNTNSNIILNADKDINIMGADILAKEDNSNITLNAGNDINISTIQDYEYERQYSKQKGGTFGTTTTKEDITQSLTNINSNITASNNLSITTGNDLTSIGTNFTAGATASNHSTLKGESNEQGLNRSSFGGGSITFNIGNDLNLYNAMDYNYEYHYLKKEKFDFASAIANIGAAVAVGALTGGVGAAVMAGISSGIGASQMQKGSIDITTNYDETTIANKLTSNNINIRTGNNLNSVSTIINDTTIDTVDTLMNLNNIKLDIGNGIGIALAEEKHEHEHIHDTWGGDIGRAALGGAITGLVTGVSMQAGKFAGKYLSGLVDNAVSGTFGTALTEATNASVNAATISTMNTIGTAMANTTIYGGNFKDVLSAGRDSLRDKDNLKSIAVSTLGAGITTGITTKLNIVKPTTFTDKLTKNAIDGATNTALQSTINGDSFKDTLKHQVVNSLVMTGAEYGANAIGSNYYNGNINKAEQLVLHAGLGAVSSKLTGGDYLSGAVSGVVGELTAELIGEKYYDGKDSLTDKQRQNITNISGLLSGLSAIVVAKSQGKDVKDIGNEAFAGQRVGQNAAQNNYLYPHEKKSLLDELDKCNGDGACKKEVQNKYKKISDKRDKEFNKILLYGSVEDLENIHYDLRDKLTKEGNEYYNSLSKEDREKEFIKLPDSASIYHTFQQDEKGNVINVLTGAEKGYVKLVHPKYGYEVVLDGNGNIVTNPVNMGTYNFYNPKLDGVESNPLINGNFNHVLYDVLPYYKLGNSKKDPTIGSDRIIRNLNILFNK